MLRNCAVSTSTNRYGPSISIDLMRVSGTIAVSNRIITIAAVLQEIGEAIGDGEVDATWIGVIWVDVDGCARVVSSYPGNIRGRGCVEVAPYS
jgi:hypothetical protein